MGCALKGGHVYHRDQIAGWRSGGGMSEEGWGGGWVEVKEKGRGRVRGG